jgi:Spy/CpxP family protein refolding chaperone
MDIRLKSALAVLALSLSCSPMLAQDDPQGPPPSAQPDPGGFGPGARMRPMGPPMGPMDQQGDWGGMRGRWRRDGRRGGRMDMGGPRMGQPEFGLSRLLSDPAIRQQVGVTTEQVAKIRQQESDFRKAEIRNRADLEVKRIDLRDLLAADQPDRAAIDSKLQEISAAQLTLEKSRIDFRLNMKGALTPEQRQKLRDALNARRQRAEGPRPRGPQGARRGARGSSPPPNPPGQAQPTQ